MAGENLVDIIGKMAKKSFPAAAFPDIVWGEVKAVDPIQIQVKNEPAMLLTQEFIRISPFCEEQRLIIPEWKTETGNEGGEGPHDHEIPEHEFILWRGLEEGDIVIMLRVSNSNLFYVMQREGPLLDTAN